MRRLIQIALLLCAGAVASWAAPARPMVEDLTLSDGTVVRGAVFSGNEFGHYWVGPDGKRYVSSENGFTLLPPEAEFLTASPDFAKSPVARTPGVQNLAPRGLVILAEFQDVRFRPMNTHAEMDSMLNGQTYQYHKSYASAKQYFHDQSLGTYNPSFDVVGPVLLPENMIYYGANTSSKGTDIRNGDMVLKACSLASQIPGVDFSLYDNNSDGMLDFVFVIHAGYGESDSHVDSLLWPASWTMGSAVRSGKTSLPTNSPVSAYTFQGKTISYYAYSSELNYYNTIYRPTPGYSDSIPLRAGVGVFCHEFGHVLGFPDYYDTYYGDNYQKCVTPGNWDIMDVGTYNEDGYVPPAYTPHERWWLGWGAPTLLNDSAEVTLPADNMTAYYITKSGNAATSTSTDTIYYIENRQQTGWDQGLPGHGLMVWRVVYNASVWASNVPNNTAGKPRYTFLPADGRYSYSGSTGLQGDAGDPYPGVENVTSCVPFPQYPINSIHEDESGVITFRFMMEADSTSTLLPEVEAREGKVTNIYTLTGVEVTADAEHLPAGVYIIRKDNGLTEKKMIR